MAKLPDKTLKAPTWFENRDWIVNEHGIAHKAGHADVTWGEVTQFADLSVRTIHPFYIEPWPFRASTKAEKWFDSDSYSEAFKFAVGHVVTKRFNLKAVRQCIANFPNA
jgi:hypothetical protein